MSCSCHDLNNIIALYVDKSFTGYNETAPQLLFIDQLSDSRNISSIRNTDYNDRRISDDDGQGWTETAPQCRRIAWSRPCYQIPRPSGRWRQLSASGGQHDRIWRRNTFHRYEAVLNWDNYIDPACLAKGMTVSNEYVASIPARYAQFADAYEAGSARNVYSRLYEKGRTWVGLYSN